MKSGLRFTNALTGTTSLKILFNEPEAAEQALDKYLNCCEGGVPYYMTEPDHLGNIHAIPTNVTYRIQTFMKEDE